MYLFYYIEYCSYRTYYLFSLIVSTEVFMVIIILFGEDKNRTLGRTGTIIRMNAQTHTMVNGSNLALSSLLEHI